MPTDSAPSPPPPVLRPAHTRRRPLAELATRFGAASADELTGVEVTGITLATADLRAGELFVAVRGAQQHGAAHAGTAVAQGAVAILTDADGAALSAGLGVPVLVVADPRAVLGEVSAWVYGTDRDLPPILGITGTNGKTSVSHLMQGILREIGVVTGLSSTAERHIGDEVIASRLTTPEAPEVHALLALMRERTVDAIILEVSAQALTRHRVDGIVFDVAGFTNLSHDHLDDYPDMTAYLEAKLALFRPERSRRGVVCLDYPQGVEVAARSEVPVTTIATQQIADPAVRADWIVTILDERADGTEFRLDGPDGRTLTTTVPVIGRHMASNAGVAVVLLFEAGWSWEQLHGAIDGTRIRADLPGRLERVSGEIGPAVYIDFAHSPDAFEKTLAAVRRITPGRVLMLTGANGDRDRTKRDGMGRTAVLGSDILVVTDQHPRSEDPGALRSAVIAGARAARPNAEIHECAPPERAIELAVSLVGEGDAILWAGPGHQHYREIAGVRTPFDAAALARDALRAAGWIPVDTG